MDGAATEVAAQQLMFGDTLFTSTLTSFAVYVKTFPSLHSFLLTHIVSRASLST